MNKYSVTYLFTNFHFIRIPMYVERRSVHNASFYHAKLMKIFSMGFQVMSSGFHSHDKLGRPAYFENTGRTDIQAMLKVIHIYSLV